MLTLSQAQLLPYKSLTCCNVKLASSYGLSADFVMFLMQCA